MKKVFSLILVLAMLLSLVVPASAAHMDVSASHSTIEAGETFTVTVSLKDAIAESAGVTAVEGSLKFDDTLLEFVKVERSQQLSGAARVGQTNEVLFYYLSLDSQPMAFAAEDLITVTFTAKKDMESNHVKTALTFEAYAVNAKGQDVADLTMDEGVALVIAKEHQWDEGEVTTEPDCENPGVKTFTCTFEDCGATYEEAVAATGHTDEVVPGTDATCTGTGLTDGKKCSVCGETTEAQQIIPAKGHTEQVIAAVAPTCTATGLSEGSKCSVCQEVTVKQTVIKATGHAEEVLPGKAATCTTAGLTDGSKCSVCGEITKAQQEIPSKGHVDADKNYICDVCEEKLCTDHQEKVIAAVAPTCTETGLTEGKMCGICGEVLVKQTVVEATGHQEENLPGKAASCTETGITAGLKCSVCGEITKEQNVIPAKGHAEVMVAGKDATCTESGLTEGKQCSVCGEVLVKQTEIAAKGHIYDDKWDTKCNVCEENNKIETVAMHRLYNPNTGEHFYTGSIEERDMLVDAGWQYEGVAWNAPKYIGAPVYRVFNPNSGDHHYTMSWDEVTMLTDLGWQYEGVAWNSANDAAVPQYRLYNPNADVGSHHYTSSTEERDFLVSLGWIWEGIGWFGLLY